MTGNCCRLLPLILLLLALRPSLPAWAASPLPSDFAYGCPLPVTDETGLYALELPLRVYQKLQQNDQGDLQVFNGAGQPVPQVLRRHAAPQESVRRPVSFFPLPVPQNPMHQDLSLQVQRHADGSIITINSEPPGTVPIQGSSFLLDLSAFSSPPTELELQWQQGTAMEMVTLTVSESSDLAHWRVVQDRVVLAELAYNGGKVSQRSFPLPGRMQPYMRLDCRDCRQPLQFTAVTALTGAAARPDQWHWQTLAREQVTNEQGWWRIESHNSARFRVTALDLAFPEPNSMARVLVESRPRQDAPWQRIGSGDFYRLDLQGSPVNSPFLPCRPNTDPWWRLSVATSGSLNGKEQLPQLRLGWQPDELLFLGRGPGPYTLAFGSTRLAEDNISQDPLILAALQRTESESRISRIEPGPTEPLAGEQALRPQAPPIPWLRILLWTVLVAGVGLLAMMARSLYREMDTNHD